MSKVRWILPAVALLLFTVGSYAQDKSATAAPVGSGSGAGNGSGQGSGVILTQTRTGVVGGVIGGYLGPGPGLSGVRGAPFSADIIDENDQLLADGNHIRQETHGRMFRDSEGRTRSESELRSFGLTKPLVSIHIFDPVEKTMIVLNAEQKTATVHHFGEAVKALEHPVQPANSARGGTGAGAPAETGGLIKNLREMQNSHEDLGTMDIDGFTVRGTRNTFTIPAGSMGNDKPMINVSERWYSEELKIELLMTSESPQSGKHVHKLVNIRSGDPDPLLFQVPQDYTVQEQPQR